MKIIQEKNYRETMDNTVLPFLKARRSSGYFAPREGQRLFYEYYTADQPKAALVLVHGFTETTAKFRETAWYFLQMGISVFLLQQREHGKSFRVTKDLNLIHLADSRELIRDLHIFVSQIVRKKMGREDLPLYLYGHSMGGGVSACYLEVYPDDFKKAILNAPMLELDSGSVPTPVATAAAHAARLVGKGASYLPGSQAFSGVEDFENSCSNCRARYQYYFDYQKAHPEAQMSVPSYQTALQFLRITQRARRRENASRVKADVLLLQAGKDSMVKPGGQEDFIRKIGSHGKLVRFPEAKHEIYLGTSKDLERYWQVIEDFLK